MNFRVDKVLDNIRKLMQDIDAEPVIKGVLQVAYDTTTLRFEMLEKLVGVADSLLETNKQAGADSCQ